MIDCIHQASQCVANASGYHSVDMPAWTGALVAYILSGIFVGVSYVMIMCDGRVLRWDPARRDRPSEEAQNVAAIVVSLFWPGLVLYGLCFFPRAIWRAVRHLAIGVADIWDMRPRRVKVKVPKIPTMRVVR